MAFNIFTTKRDSCLGQYDRIDDFITCKLCGDKSPVVRQFEVDKFNFSAVFKCLDPRFVLHFRISLTEGSICRKYTPYAPRIHGLGMAVATQLLVSRVIGNLKSTCTVSALIRHYLA